MKLGTKQLAWLAKATIVLSGGMSATACATTQVAQGQQTVPVVFKINSAYAKDVSVKKYVSLNGPIAAPVLPSQNVPSLNQPRAQQVTKTEFDQSQVDSQFYKHQILGKPYKISGKIYRPKHEPDYNKTGLASWYGPKFHGKPTASGEIFDKNDYTAAHPTLPLNSQVFVTNMTTGQTLMVRINDRGPFVENRLIDLSEASARALGTIQNGLAKIRVQYAGPADPVTAANLYKAPNAAPKPQIADRPAPLVAQPHATRPAPQAPAYRPLRDLGGMEMKEPVVPPSQETVLPETITAPQQSLPVPIFEQPVIPAPVPQMVEQDRLAPVTVPRPDHGGQITLTIKGPIHMASSKSDDIEPQWIDAVNRTETLND